MQVPALLVLVQALVPVRVDRLVQALVLVPEQVAHRRRPERLRVRSVLLPEVVADVRSIRRPKKVQ